MEKSVTGECHSCESSYDINYMQELTSEDYPHFCPFCGEMLVETEESQEDDE